MKKGNKTASPISKSVLAILSVGILLVGLAIWRGHASHEKSGPSLQVVATTPAAPPLKPATLPAPPTPAPSVRKDDGSLPVIPISLTNLVIQADIDHADPAMKALPHGTQVYGGIEFWLQGMLHLQSEATQEGAGKNFRSRILVPLAVTNSEADGTLTVTQRGQYIASIYLVGGTRFLSPVGDKFADVVWHYTDGTLNRSGLQFGVHLRNWVRSPYETPTQLTNALTRIAWHGSHPTQKNRTIRMYRLALVNPHPEKVIRAIEFVSAMIRPSLFICALTLDPLLPGARPDDLSSEEVADPELNGLIQISVVDTAGHPLPDAAVTANFQSTSLGAGSQKSTTDNNGLAQVRYPDTGLEHLLVSATHDGFSGQQMSWDTTSGDTIPASYTLKLSGELKIGGLVVDPEKTPISGATVSINRFWRGGDSPNAKGERPSFSNQTLTTDAEGRWEAKGLPLGLIDSIDFNVKHPDYLTANVNLGATEEKQLREFTYQTVLQRGADVIGRVLDGSDIPIAGATVWAGRKWTADRRQTTSGDDGSFFFHIVPDGEVLFSVMAKGHSPANKTFLVQTNMSEIVFRLKDASVIRAHVQDESGQSVAGAHIDLEGNYDDPGYAAYEYSGNTDSKGDFTWDSAPTEPMLFNIYQDGFADKEDVKLAPNQDNTVILHPVRKLSGLVLDASTAQPVTKFTIRTGTANDDNSTVYGVIRDKSFTAADGRFTGTLDEEAYNAVSVTADDYASKVERITDAKDGTSSVTVQLTPSASLSGVVMAPDGTPTPGISVAAGVGTTRGSLQLSNGHLHSYDPGPKVAVTDEQGHFKVAVSAEDGTVVAAGDLGFASVPVATVRSSGTLALLAWGRIEGSLKIGGQPGVGKDLKFNLTIPGMGTDIRATTDDQGKFTMEKIPPGEGEIIRLIKTSPNTWTWSDRSPVTVKAGETTPITLGDNGAVIVGHMRYDTPPTNDAALVFDGNLSMATPQQPRFDSPADAQAYYKSPEWQALMKLRKSYTLEMKADGSFNTDGVVPGDYTLDISVRVGGPNMWQHPTLAHASLPVTVPDSFDPASPINVGEITLQPVLKQPDAAPQN